MISTTPPPPQPQPTSTSTTSTTTSTTSTTNSSTEENILPQLTSPSSQQLHLSSLSTSTSTSTPTTPPSIRVFVRTPSDALPQNFSCPVHEHSTVRDLKILLTTEHPLKPKPEDQRLIFCGKVLEEEARILDILKKCDLSVSQTFHLVVRHSSAENLNRPPVHSTTTTLPQPPPPPPPSIPSHIPDLPPSPQYTLNESFRYIPNSTARFHTEILMNGIRYQHVRINGLPYLMSLPYPHYGAAGGVNDLAATMAGAADGLPGRPPDPLQGAMHPGRPGNEVRGVGGGQGSIQLAIKIGVLLLIFCRNASIERVILMHIAALVIFLHQTGRLRVVRGRVLPNGDIAVDRNDRMNPPTGATAATVAAAARANNHNQNNENMSPVSAIFQGVWAFLSSMVPSTEVEEA